MNTNHNNTRYNRDGGLYRTTSRRNPSTSNARRQRYDSIGTLRQPGLRQPGLRQPGLLDTFANRLKGEQRSPAGRWAGPSSSVAQKNVAQLRLDVPLLLTVITLLILGVVMVYSASYDYSQNWYGNSSTIFLRQLIWLGVGTLAAFALTFFDYHWFRPLALLIMGVTIFLLLAVLFNDHVLNGAARTLFGGSVQPSELAKLAIVIYLSVWLYARQDQLRDAGFGLFPLAGIIGIVGGLILLQPDLSAVVTICALGGLLFFLAGGDLKQMFILMGFAMLVGWGVVAMSSTGSARLSAFLAGLVDPTQGSYHVRRSFDAFVKGGWFGVGIGNGEVKLTGLPVPPTDSIFAVVGEETGVFGSVLLVGLFMVFLWRGLVIARRAPDKLGALLAAGLTLWICMEAFVNMAVMVNLLPFAGNALPFISAGGSSMLMSLAAVGILMNISRNTAPAAGRERNDGIGGSDAFVDLRRRNRRRSVSGANGSADDTDNQF